MVADIGGFSDTSIQPEELASQSVRLKEEQLRREEEKVSFIFLSYLCFLFFL